MEQSTVIIGREKGTGNFLLFKDGQKFSEPFSIKAEGFQVILSKFLEEEISFTDLKKLFKTIDESELIPVMKILEYKNDELVNNELNLLSQKYDVTIYFFSVINSIIFQFNQAMNGDIFPRVIDCGSVAYIQIEKIEKINFQKKEIHSKKIQTEVLEKELELNIKKIKLDLKRSPEFDTKSDGLEVVKKLWRQKKIDDKDKERLFHEISNLSLPINKVVDPSKEILN